jgi:uncharacterized protein YbaA (DUF1428 family)
MGTAHAAKAKAKAKVMDPGNSDPRMDHEKNPIPCDGKRMIFGDFAPIVS